MDSTSPESSENKVSSPTEASNSFLEILRNATEQKNPKLFARLLSTSASTNNVAMDAVMLGILSAESAAAVSIRATRESKDSAQAEDAN